ncbi:MAG: hypothetical protein K6E28_09840 [Eubacterium sp.]|nr:hypothetical protein [Eubacterium sp.]
MDVKLFNPLYGCYFSTVYHILKEAGSRELNNKEYCDLIRTMSEIYGFPGITSSVIEGAINLGENEKIEDNKDAWPFFDKKTKEKESGSPINPKVVQYHTHKNRLNNISGFPLSTIEKMWLKSVYSDPRIRLFILSDVDLPKFNDVEPLFNWDDFILFDQYTDGDPFQDKHYIEMFRKVLEGVRKKARLEIKFRKHNYTISFNADGTYEKLPDNGIGMLYVDTDYLEYSERDNKFRLIGNNPRYGRNMVNIASIVDCREVEKIDIPNAELQNTYSRDGFQRDVIFELIDSNNVLERFLLNFSHYEKVAEYIKEQRKYRITIFYDETDETDLVIRTLSFGPYVKVVEPMHFKNLITDRLWQQMMHDDLKKTLK